MKSMLDVEGLTKVFPSRRRGPTAAVDGVSFNIGEHEVVGLLGANGAGKTTTIKCLCGLVEPTGGLVTLDGVSVTDRPRLAATKCAVVLEGNRNLYWRMTPLENIDFFAGLQGVERRQGIAMRDELLERFGLTAKARTPTRMLSRGMQQKLALACALARRTPLLLLDEPTLGLDVETSHELRAYLRELAATDHTILLSSHDMAVVQDVCERVVVMKDGRVVADDKVANLLALFHAQAYRFTLDRLGADAVASLEARFPVITIESGVDGCSVEIDLTDQSDLYVLMSMFENAGAQVLSIDRQEPDLEQVFLRLIEGERR
jgi:ABC-2 type transport system ATP-binding protein